MENQRTLPFLSQEPALRSSPTKRLLLSFWEREIHIWRLAKASKPTSDLDDSDNESTSKNKKLVAKILIKGEANITSAALSADGNLLAVSTVADIKVFHVRARKSEDSDALRVSKIDVPSNFSSGARLVQFSPDGKWLSIIRPDSRIFVARVLSSASSYSFYTHLSKLERINRKIEKHITLGGLGTYDRTITQAEFSSDSRILAVSDLAGYVDTFVLSGEEDLTLEPLPSAQSSAASSTSPPSSDLDSDSDSEAPLQQIYGQHWTPNPSGATLPKLPSTPTVLSFRPTTTLHPNSTPTHAIPTRHTPNPISHALPAGDHRLLIATATSDIYEFDVLRGGLSAWSRRNPPAAFPAAFRKVRDLAKGCFWDVQDGRERVWLYGAAWLWMFDLSQDFPAEAAKNRKRKRHGKEDASGAGSSIPNEKLLTGMSRKMERVVNDEAPDVQDVPYVNEQDAMDLDSESDSGTALRRTGSVEATGTKSYWQTFKYRPILGICVVGEGASEVGPEVAIVERPIWEADLGPRFSGDQEWEKGNLSW